MRNSVPANVISLIAFSLIVASPAYAQSKDAPPVAEPDTTITVTGTKAEKKEIRREARSFAGAMMAPILGQYSRRQTGICPLVIGIDPSYHKVIYAKIRSIASQIGAKVADNNCKTNSFIIFSSNGVDTLAQLRKEQPPIFA